jgi:heme-degrading monooxygenase HmoA
MSKASFRSLHRYLLSSVLVAVLSFVAFPVSAEPVLRLVSATAAGPKQLKEIKKTAPGKLYAAAKGCEWVKFWYDEATGETGSLSLWDSRDDLNTFLNSDAYKAMFPGKLKSLTKGNVSAKVYSVYEPTE